MEFPKNYNFKESESKWYENWKNQKLFSTNTDKNLNPYSILMPPPNVTGILHFGHVLNHTLQDLYIRWKRMNGFNVCWFPGLDHAGIATQTRVEKELKQSTNQTKYDLGREKFIEKVWDWKEKYGGIILNQLEKLGVSCDWDKTLFTMDEEASYAVREVFIRLFDEGLIYKGKRIINWSPLSMTALSDEEVEFKSVNEKFYTLKYKIENSNEFLEVATVRPETIYGDVAVAVNPNDPRYEHLIGKNVVIPFVNRAIPVIADDYADPEFGTGCVKVTPAHDPNDFEIGLRHNLEAINTISLNGYMNELAGELNGMERFEARKKIVKLLEENELIAKIEDYTHNVGFSQRGGEPIEPMLSDQWFVNMKPLAAKALELVESGEINFHPKHWTKTYQHWMNNIKDWCISRQLWWGHRIPVYYTEDGRFTAAQDEITARTKLGIDSQVKITQDEDVLDTWFSSWLWPMTTMKWLANGKESNEEMNYFLPTDLLVTGPDIIFFWVARMIMATSKFTGKVPFKDVYFTSMIRDGQGRKLSKSLGNSPDPLNIIEKYGADAVRFTMIYLAPLGTDVRMDVDVKSQDISSMELGRNFANKLWNAGRFLLMKKSAIENYVPSNISAQSRSHIWIQSKLNSVIATLNDSLTNYKVNEYSKLLYDFIWRDYCDWYVEAVKTQFYGANSDEEKSVIIDSAINIYKQILLLIHPIMPYISEEIWNLINEDGVKSISINSYPQVNYSLIDEKTEREFNDLQQVVEELRKLRNVVNIAPSMKLKVTLLCNDDNFGNLVESEFPLLRSLAGIESLEIINSGNKPEGTISTIFNSNELCIHVTGLIDVESEKSRINSEIERLNKQIWGIKGKLANAAFVEKAPIDVVTAEKKKLEDWTNSIEKLQNNLSALSNL